MIIIIIYSTLYQHTFNAKSIFTGHTVVVKVCTVAPVTLFLFCVFSFYFVFSVIFCKQKSESTEKQTE